jgi:hypothetical protein
MKIHLGKEEREMRCQWRMRKREMRMKYRKEKWG